MKSAADSVTDSIAALFRAELTSDDVRRLQQNVYCKSLRLARLVGDDEATRRIGAISDTVKRSNPAGWSHANAQLAGAFLSADEGGCGTVIAGYTDSLAKLVRLALLEQDAAARPALRCELDYLGANRSDEAAIDFLADAFAQVGIPGGKQRARVFYDSTTVGVFMHPGPRPPTCDTRPRRADSLMWAAQAKQEAHDSGR